MLRQLVCGLVALALVAGVALAADKSGKTVTGKFVSYKDGALTINVGKTGEEKPQEFKIADDFSKVTVYSGDTKKDSVIAKDAFKELKAGTSIKVTLDDNKKVTAVQVGNAPKIPKTNK
jgi:hypothetical protein